MILEALNFAATYAVTPRRDAGEIHSSVTLWSRARRCARHWAAHEAHCKAFIRDAIKTLPQTRTVAVLGSGLLRDIPIEDLAKTFRAVRLYDLQHLASIRAWAALKGFGNLSFDTRDLSGYAALSADPGRDPQPLAFLGAIADLDLVISANLLSQIGLGVGVLTGRDATAPADAVARLIQAHIDGLLALPAPACLLTDTSYEVTDRNGKVLESDDLTKGVPLPPAQADWSWTVAPFGELDAGYQAVHRVAGIRLKIQVDNTI